MEFSYVREAAQRRILPTNMIGTTCADPFMFPSSLEDPQAEGDRPWKHANTFEFHGLQTKVPVRKRKSYLFRLKDFLGELLWVPTGTRISNHKYINSCYWWCLRKLGKELFESGEYSEEEFAHYQSKEQFYRHLGYTYLDHETRLNPDSFVEGELGLNRLQTIKLSKIITLHLTQQQNLLLNHINLRIVIVVLKRKKVYLVRTVQI